MNVHSVANAQVHSRVQCKVLDHQRSARCPTPFVKVVQRKNRAHSSIRNDRRSFVTHAGLLDFLSPAAAKASPQAEGLVDELLEIASRTNGGSKASSDTRETIDGLVEQLQRFRPRGPTRSPLFTGDYKVLYTSNPRAPGGPVLRSGPGQAVFAGQQLRQRIQAPDVFENFVGFKTLGIFPGTAVQQGRWRALDGNRYVVRPCMPEPIQVDLEPASLKVGVGGGVDQPGEAVQRTFEVLYLDERARVVRFLPDADSDSEPQLFIFERIPDKAGEAQEEEEGDDEEQQAERPFLQRFGSRSREGLATQAERSFREEASPAPAQAPRGRGRRAAPAPTPAAPERSSEQADKVRQREAVRAQLMEITSAYKAAQAQARDAQQQLKDLERSAAQARKESGPALERVRVADATVEAADAQLRSAQEAAAAAEREVQSAKTAVRELEVQGRR